MLLAVSMLLLGLLEASQVLELRASKGSRATWLEGASEEQLGGEKRGELHVESCPRARHVVDVGLRRRLVLAHVLGVERRNIASARVSVGKSRDVGSEGTVREASVAVGRLRGMALEAVRGVGTVAALTNRPVEVLHT